MEPVADIPFDATENAPIAEPLLTSSSIPLSSTSRPRRVRFREPLTGLFDPKKFDRLTVEHFKANKFRMYYKDIFHTLINMPNHRFLLLFLASYVSMYTVYAFLYMSQPRSCISLVSKFSHALWFSVHTSATIGYGHMAPDPDCLLLNLTILKTMVTSLLTMLPPTSNPTCSMAQVLTTALMQAALLGLVYARFSAPSSRSATIKFSSILTMYRDDRDGLYRLAFRVANMRKHQVLQPEVRMLIITREQVFDDGPWEFRYHELPLHHIGGGSRLWLGVPSIMAHKVDDASPLWRKGKRDLEGCDCEFVVLLDGIDESTSTAMQARHSYFASDIRWGEAFAGVLARQATGTLRADYSHFDLTRIAEGGTCVDEEQGLGSEESSSIGVASSLGGGVNDFMPYSTPISVAEAAASLSNGA